MAQSCTKSGPGPDASCSPAVLQFCSFAPCTQILHFHVFKVAVGPSGGGRQRSDNEYAPAPHTEIDVLVLDAFECAQKHRVIRTQPVQLFYTISIILAPPPTKVREKRTSKIAIRVFIRESVHWIRSTWGVNWTNPRRVNSLCQIPPQAPDMHQTKCLRKKSQD